MKRVDLAELCRRISLLDLLPPDARPRKTGADAWISRCTFHEDSRPSMSVRLLNRGWRFHCFTCGEDGSVLDYYCRTRKVTLPEALKALLATSVGSLPEPPKPPGVVVVCTFCSARRDFTGDRVWAAMRATQLGWHVSDGGTYDLCPACLEKRLRDPERAASVRIATISARVRLAA